MDFTCDAVTPSLLIDLFRKLLLTVCLSFYALGGIFHRRLECSLRKWGFLSYVCALLHNFCLRTGQGDPAPRLDSDVLPNDTCAVISNSEPAGSRLIGLQRTRRFEITADLESSGTTRPATRFTA